jgi:hypothetical protein
MPPDESSERSTGRLGHGAGSIESSADLVMPTQRRAADHPAGRLGAPSCSGATPGLVPTPELVEQVAEELYNSLDPRFVDWEWWDATEGAREWARGRARQMLAARRAAPTGARQPSDRGTR